MVLKHRYRNRTKKTNKKYKRNTLRTRVRRKSNKKVKRRNKKRMKGGANQEHIIETQKNIDFTNGKHIKVQPIFKITILDHNHNQIEQDIIIDINITINNKLNNSRHLYNTDKENSHFYKKEEYNGIIDSDSLTNMLDKLSRYQKTLSRINNIANISKITENVKIVKETFGKDNFNYVLFFYDEQKFGIPLSMEKND